MTHRFCRIYFLCVLFLVFTAGCRQASTPGLSPAPDVITSEVKDDVKTKYGKVPPYFIENRGQVDEKVKYYVKGSRGTVFFTPGEVAFDFRREIKDDDKEDVGRPGRDKRSEEKNYERLVFRISFPGANPAPSLEGKKELPGKINYLIGSKDNWRTSIPTFEKVVYKGLYDGIDLTFLFDGALLTYVFRVSPGADPRNIALTYEGIDGLDVKPEGNLVVNTPFGGFVEKAPSLHQEVKGEKVPVEGKFSLKGKNSMTFEIGSYDARRDLWIDPEIPY